MKTCTNKITFNTVSNLETCFRYSMPKYSMFSSVGFSSFSNYKRLKMTMVLFIAIYINNSRKSIAYDGHQNLIALSGDNFIN